MHFNLTARVRYIYSVGSVESYYITEHFFTIFNPTEGWHFDLILFSLSNSKSKFVGYLMQKPSLYKDSINLKVNVIARLGFEHAYKDFAVNHVRHYVAGTPLVVFKKL